MNPDSKLPGNNSLPQGTNMGANPTGGAPSKSQAIAQGVDMLDKATDKITGGNENTPKLGEQVIDPNQPKEPMIDEEGNVQEGPGEEGPKVGDKVAPGYEIGEDGKVKQSATSKLQGAVARGAAAYFSGGNAEAMDAAGKVSDSKIGRKISDTLEKNKAVEKAAEELEDVADTVNNAADAIAKAKSGDVSGAIDSVKEAKKSSDKAGKKVRNIMIIGSLAGFAFILLVVLFPIMLLFGLFGDETGTSTEQVYMNSYNYEWTDIEDDSSGHDEDTGTEQGGSDTPIDNAEIQKIIDEIPGWDSLSSGRKAVIKAALSAVGLKYHFGGKASGPGLSGIPSDGIDCSGFVNWSYWTGLGSNPSFGGTANLASNYSTWFNKITYDQMKPGDVVVRRSGSEGHTAIYLGNDKYVHAKGRKYGIVVSTNTNHSYYQYNLTYRGI